MNPSWSPRPRGLPGSSPYRVPGPGGEYISQSPRPAISHHQLEYGPGGVPALWAAPVPQAVQMPVQQDVWRGPPPPPPMYTVQQSPSHPAAEPFPSSPVAYAQYSPQVAPPPNYGSSQPQYSPVVAPPPQQVYVVANAPVAPPPATSQFVGGGPPAYQMGFVPTGQPVASQSQQVQEGVSSGVPGAGCIVASPPQQYVLANQPLVVPANQPYVDQQYTKTTPPTVMPQQFVMMPTQQYVISPAHQAGVPPPPAGQVYSVVANQSAPSGLRPGGPQQCVVHPLVAGQRIPFHVAAVPNQFQPIAVPANQLPVLPANQIQPMMMIPANALQVASANQAPPQPTVPANQMQSTQQAPPPQPVYCYVPSASVGSPAVNSELGPAAGLTGKGVVSIQQQPAATAVIQVSHTHAHTRLTALFWDYPGEPVPER